MNAPVRAIAPDQITFKIIFLAAVHAQGIPKTLLVEHPHMDVGPKRRPWIGWSAVISGKIAIKEIALQILFCS